MVKKDETRYVLKVSEILHEDENLDSALKDLNALQKLKGKQYVVQLIDHTVMEETIQLNEGTKKKKKILAILQYGSQGTLYDFLGKNGWHYFFDSQKLLILAQKIMIGLRNIHEQNIVHSDIKPDNIVIDEAGDPLLIDFGFSQKKNEEGAIKGPENFKDIRAFANPKVAQVNEFMDTYPLGVMLYMFSQGKLPFEVDDFRLNFFNNAEVLNTHLYDFKVGTSLHLINIIHGCLRFDVTKRIPLDALLAMTTEALESKDLKPILEVNIAFNNQDLADADSQNNKIEELADNSQKKKEAVKIKYDIDGTIKKHPEIFTNPLVLI